MTTPSLGLIQLVLRVLGDARSWEGDPTADVFQRLLKSMDRPVEAEGLPAAVGEVLPTLRFAPDALRVALDLVSDFDLHEAWPGVVNLLRNEDTQNAHVLVAAAALAAHPGVPDVVRDLVYMRRGAVDLEPWQQRLIAIRLDPDAVPDGRLEELARAQQWPGTEVVPVPVPIVAIHDSAGTALDRFRLQYDLRAAGVASRRLPLVSANTELDARWLARWIPLVANVSVAQGTYLQALPHGVVIPVEAELFTAVRRRVQRRISELFPSLSLRSTTESPLKSSGEGDLLSTEAFNAGSYNRYELAFFAGTRRDRTKRFLQVPELHPQSVRGIYYWTFSQVVAVRTWRYFDSVVNKPLGAAVAGRLVSFARSENARLVGVTELGRVLASDRGNYVDIETGQIAEGEVVEFSDRVFRPFALGGGRAVPDLLEPSRHTRAHPLLLGGAAVVERTRVTASAIHEVASSARRNSGNWREKVAAQFPELSMEQIEDAEQLARSVLST